MKYPDKENKYYDKKGDKWEYWISSGYKYWSYKPWMRKDNGKPLKKNWRKKWTMLKSKVELSTDIGRVVNLMTFGVKNITNEENIKKKIQPNVSLTVWQACLELWLNITSFYYYLSNHPDLREQYELLKENRREYIRELSENNIQKAISWKMKWLQDKDVVDYSFRLLEKTDKNYNPKQVVETTVEEVNADRSTDDIISDIADLIK